MLLDKKMKRRRTVTVQGPIDKDYLMVNKGIQPGDHHPVLLRSFKHGPGALLRLGDVMGNDEYAGRGCADRMRPV